MKIQYCPVCGMPAHEVAWIPLEAKSIDDVWNLWLCDNCKWVSDWPGMPDFLRRPEWSGPISDPSKSTGGAYGK